LEHPILGAGLEAFGVAFNKTRHSGMGFFRVEQAHNEYLQTLADAGIAGFVCVFAFVYLLFIKRAADDRLGKRLSADAAIGGTGGCFGILIHSFFDFPLRTPSNAFFFSNAVCDRHGSCAVGAFRPFKAPPQIYRTLTTISLVPQGSSNLI
jgi:O-antigen ligase